MDRDGEYLNSSVMDYDLSKPHEECGVFGIYSDGGTAPAYAAYNGLLALQHRGQESCGIAVCDRGVISYSKDMGLVTEAFNDKILDDLVGQMAVGHVRYSTAGGSVRENAQPLVMRYIKGTLAIAHNGNLTNAYELRHELEHRGCIFQTTIDTEVIAYIIARERVDAPSIEEAVRRALPKIQGSYSLVVMSPQKLIAARDPHGFRPLCIGRLDNSYVFASETCALDACGAEYVRDVEPGEIVVVDSNGLRSIKDPVNVEKSLCVFEYIYFARTDSYIDGKSVYEARKEAGRLLAKQNPVEADIVIGVPESGIDAAIGYSEESGIPYQKGIVKNSYIGRTFIKPSQSERVRSVRIKLNALSSCVKGKRVVMLDDSIVRGTTSARIVTMLKDAGATEVHLRISSPPFLWPCYYGTDIPSKDDLIACQHSIEEIGKMSFADSIDFLHLDNLPKMMGGCSGFCDACFSGKYPAPVPDYLIANKNYDYCTPIKRF
ncbi:amidophosphoribosyltransferase [Clostridium sp. KNHs216]|uniref:amidophosphoribosyltransferase n=2 Tax=Eubacteriales TaxID=186802 RepID=UPI0011725A56|nr:amidophosphoribosyltransferase [Clostridium sp. KNHs216]TQI65609.1 amidophosphoribosyltransferase [Clostridium sp. KNHs216]